MKVFSICLLYDLVQPFCGEAYRHFEDDESHDAIFAFFTGLSTLDSVSRCDADEPMIPILKPYRGKFFDYIWVCPECGCKLADYSSQYTHTQTNGDYCPDCGKRINWPAVSDDITRTRSFFSADNVRKLISEVKTPEVAAFMSEKLMGKDIELPVNLSVEMCPTFRSFEVPMFVDYGIGSNIGGECRVEKDDNYLCPICEGFVDAVGGCVPAVFRWPGYKGHPCNWCPSCGQRINWKGIDLDPEKYDVDAIK